MVPLEIIARSSRLIKVFIGSIVPAPRPGTGSIRRGMPHFYRGSLPWYELFEQVTTTIRRIATGKHGMRSGDTDPVLAGWLVKGKGNRIDDGNGLQIV